MEVKITSNKYCNGVNYPISSANLSTAATEMAFNGNDACRFCLKWRLN
jgi:hypothetical protein